ncbi:peptidoglycan-binding protein [Psychromicrobium lacuslunae]|uniref:Peptidoglycan-binding protein n=2 Tax=Psychromicrobium lacuslunae TaxID=1618207 RepID=A0A0D4C1W4_9MICC|nr:peptidoglycan-binding protein [Psychromicrobium lacuslunae]
MTMTDQGFSRKTFLKTGALGAAAAVLSVPTLGAGLASAALPAVNMEKVVLAAQVDPYRGSVAITAGAGPSVKLVQQALIAKKFLAAGYADGNFGKMTIAAYKKYQQSLGYTGLDASGLPGPTSLKKLGTNRYTVTRPITVGAKTTVSGKRVNTRTKNMLVAAGKRAGITMSLTQGSYNPGGVGASAGTHDGGGVVDISVSGKTSAQMTKMVKALREVGFAAWHRTPAQGFAHHIHAVAICDTDMSPSAQAQVGDYYRGRNGLASHAADDGPKVTKTYWEEYLR